MDYAEDAPTDIMFLQMVSVCQSILCAKIITLLENAQIVIKVIQPKEENVLFPVHLIQIVKLLLEMNVKNASKDSFLVKIKISVNS